MNNNLFDDSYTLYKTASYGMLGIMSRSDEDYRQPWDEKPSTRQPWDEKPNIRLPWEGMPSNDDSTGDINVLNRMRRVFRPTYL